MLRRSAFTCPPPCNLGADSWAQSLPSFFTTCGSECRPPPRQQRATRLSAESLAHNAESSFSSCRQELGGQSNASDQRGMDTPPRGVCPALHHASDFLDTIRFLTLLFPSALSPRAGTPEENLTVVCFLVFHFPSLSPCLGYRPRD